MNARIPAVTVTGTGAADGYLTVTANDGVYPGAKGWITKSDNTLPQLVLVTDIVSTTKVGVRFIPESASDPKLQTGAVVHPSYGRTGIAAYTAGSILSLPAQLVEVQQPVFDPIPSILP